MINFQTQQKLKEEFLNLLQKIQDKNILNTTSDNINTNNINLFNNITHANEEETKKKQDFIIGYTNWVKIHQKELGYLIKNNFKNQEKSTFINQLSLYPNELFLAFLEIPKINEDDTVFAVFLQKFDTLFSNNEFTLDEKTSNQKTLSKNVSSILYEKLIKNFLNKYLSLLIANPIKPLEFLENKALIYSNKTKFLEAKFEKEFLSLIENQHLSFYDLCDEFFAPQININSNVSYQKNIQNPVAKLSAQKIYETAKNKLLRNLPIQFHEKFLIVENQKINDSLLTLETEKEKFLVFQPLSSIYLIIKELENNHYQKCEEILNNIETYYKPNLIEKINHNMLDIYVKENLKLLSKNLLLLPKENIEFLLEKLSPKLSSNHEVFSFELIYENMNLKNNGFKEVFPLEKLELLSHELTLEPIPLNKFNDFFIFLFNQYDILNEDALILLVLQNFKNHFEKVNAEKFELIINYESDDTYVDSAPNTFEQILINFSYEDKKMPQSIFDYLLSLSSFNQKIQFEHIIPLYSLSFNIVDDPMLAFDSLNQKFGELKDSNYQGSLEENVLLILSLCDENFLSFSEILMKVIEKKIKFPLSHKTLKDILIEQKLVVFTEKMKIVNQWDELSQMDKVFYLSLRKVQNKIEQQAKSSVMEIDDLITSFEPFKVKNLNISIKPESSVNAEKSIDIDELISHALTLKLPILEAQPNHTQVEMFSKEVSKLENIALTQEIENFFYAHERLKKWVDSQDILNKKLFYLEKPIALISPSLYAKLVLNNDMLKEGVFLFSNETEANLNHEYNTLIEKLIHDGTLNEWDRVYLDKKMNLAQINKF